MSSLQKRLQAHEDDMDKGYIKVEDKGCYGSYLGSMVLGFMVQGLGV